MYSHMTKMTPPWARPHAMADAAWLMLHAMLTCAQWTMQTYHYAQWLIPSTLSYLTTVCWRIDQKQVHGHSIDRQAC